VALLFAAALQFVVGVRTSPIVVVDAADNMQLGRRISGGRELHHSDAWRGAEGFHDCE
jgi:hypothetical protein